MKRALVPASLLVLAGCQQPGPQNPRPYAAAEEGLTLVYINPSLPKEQQDAKRLQVRVDKVVTRNDGATVVLKTFTPGIGKPFASTFVLQDGGVAMLSPDGKSEAPILPKGFPEALTAWSEGASEIHVLGRGAWTRGDETLPADRSSEGVWVEERAQSGRVQRTLYMQGLGEVESDELQPDGRWMAVNLLVQYGFTDLPAAPATAEPDLVPDLKHSAKPKTKTKTKR